MNRKRILTGVLVIALLTCGVKVVFANGGPFVVKYPDGDPAAKGALARIGTDLMPGRETKLRVVEEELKVSFSKDPMFRGSDNKMPPLGVVSAEYTIENPTDEEVKVDFGFPILRGIYMQPYSMMPMPDVRVQLGEKNVATQIISNSVIYGIIRQKARAVIDEAVAADSELSQMVGEIRKSSPDKISGLKADLVSYLTSKLKWTETDAVLMSEYAGLEIGKQKLHPKDRGYSWGFGMAQFNEIVTQNMGPLTAIGEQKTTQFFAQLASCFDPESGSTYEKIFEAWGGDVRQRAVDMSTGKLRPRELKIDVKNEQELALAGHIDPTIYARVDYFDEKAKISDYEKASCKAILKNLPVIFTFSPMNILYYQASFAPGETTKLTVTYKQYAFKDTAGAGSYQLAYVVHPASLWDDFGPINLEVVVPAGVSFKASVPCEQDKIQRRIAIPAGNQLPPRNAISVGNLALADSLGIPYDVYRTVLKDKKGEIYLSIDKDQWDGLLPMPPKQVTSKG